MKILVPMKTNQSLKFVMEEGDAELIERVMAQGDNFVYRMFELSQWL